MIDLPKIIMPIVLAAVLSSCASADCSLPKEWIEARAMQPMLTPGSYKPVLYSQETERGRWRWMVHESRGRQSKPTSGDYEKLLTEVAAATELNPQPLLLFSFDKSRDCNELSRVRKGIVEAAKCSKDGVPCIEGTLTELLAAS